MAIAGGALVVLLLAWYLLLWSPKAKALSAADKRVVAAQSQLGDVQLQLAQAKSLESRESEVKASLARLEEAVPDKRSLADFILAANDAAHQAGVDFLTITPTKQAVSMTAGAPPEIVLTLTLSAPYGPTLDFVQRLLGLHRLFVVDTLEMASSGGDLPANGSAGPLTVTIGGRMFTNEPAALPAGTTATTTPTTPPTTAVKP
jgi:Tfp pilus assembly protein PilO